ncbi:ABC-F family ATP-binding cassette domain-containing protein [Actinokineospora cianjurensis]|uniref:ATPase subunit of ABC transporter with duplicated ATPase domains n=1 Tax=Actinokineospora cianjurensis TaxID=585224 RepID=A0A421BBM7_9PSEU|nr:ABC-F family ATP-binding cassette domain-containing protein [Actinokineospora cianjurensis]RLK61759.1 ATPase subunit of ABC transporter with duplicated ATPase domains [Actinokineospora cianjurensis]
MAISCTDLAFSWPDDTPVFEGLSFTVGAGRTGLVGVNGSGKSTLLKLLAGEYRPSAGSVVVDGLVGYLPQTLPLGDDLSVAEVLGIDRVLAALLAVESGDVRDEHFTTIGVDWDVEERTRAQLARLGLADVDFDRRLGTLSGGQVVSLGLAAQLVTQPDVLLLDEPTNNLDADARARLYEVLAEWPGCLLVVSHDRELLDRVDRIAEVTRGEVRVFGGNFTEWDAASRAAREAAERTVRDAEQEVKREKRELQQARERAARRAGNAARTLDSAGLPRIFAGNMKRRAQESAGRADGTHSARVSGARARLDSASRAVRDDDRLVLELPETTVPAGRTLFHRTGVQARGLFAPPGLTLDIRGPERIALTGPNGSGKSTLLRLIRDAVPAAYLSQRLDVLDPTLSVSDNLALSAPSMPRPDRMNLLARFLFRGDRAHLPVSVLSGGELLRATLAYVLFAEPAPHLLLLDEPTNNLDLAGVTQLESALTAYKGAFVVVSHDTRFLASLSPTRHLTLTNGTLTG